MYQQNCKVGVGAGSGCGYDGPTFIWFWWVFFNLVFVCL